MTNIQIITKALQEIGLVAEGEEPTGEQGFDALDALNQMMAEWAVSDRDLNFPPQDTLSATCPIPAWAEDGVISNLAVNCCSIFRVPATGVLVDRANTGLNTITRTLINLNLEGADMSHLPRGTLSYWNIETGSF